MLSEDYCTSVPLFDYSENGPPQVFLVVGSSPKEMDVELYIYDVAEDRYLSSQRFDLSFLPESLLSSAVQVRMLVAGVTEAGNIISHFLGEGFGKERRFARTIDSLLGMNS